MMESNEHCYCGGEKPYALCCEPFHSGTKLPDTPEELMRSRYTAYVLKQVGYLIETTAPQSRKYYSPRSIMEWASESKWLALEIVEAKGKRVKFIATYLDAVNQLTFHREDSLFEQINGRWYFVDGQPF